MAYVNLPISLSGMFDDLDERLARVETGYSGPQESADAAQATAVSAQALALTSQSTASNAQVQAINAGIQANLAASQATIAQSQATIASSQAVSAQTSANGKNTILYGTSATPPTGTYKQGDIYYQYDGSNHIKSNQQYNGTSWQPAPFTQGTFTALDAGSITTGILNAIEINAGTGGTAFHVSPSGYLSAQGVYVKGNITADSGTFNGTINAQTGYFGGTTNYWSIGSNGITGVGLATITAGQINGSSIYIGSSGQFQVDASGNLNASNATITGTIHASLGDVGGFTIGSTYLSSGVNFYLNASTGDAKLNSVSIGSAGTYYLNSSGALSASTVTTSSSLSVGTNAFISGQTELAGNLQVDAVAAVASPTSTNFDTLLYNKTGTAGTQYRVYRVNNLSSAQYKDNITYFPDKNYTSIVSQMKPITFTYKPDQVEDPQTIVMGLLAEDIDAIDGAKELVDYLDEKPNAIRYEKIPLFMIKAISEINDRLTKLEGK